MLPVIMVVQGVKKIVVTEAHVKEQMLRDIQTMKAVIVFMLNKMH